MLNAPYSNGRCNRTAYQQLPGIPFARQEKPVYQPMAFEAFQSQSLSAYPWQRFPSASQNGFPSVATQQGWAWPQQTQNFQKPDKLDLIQDAEPEKPPVDGQNGKNKSDELLKQAQQAKVDAANPKDGGKKAGAAELKAQSGKVDPKKQQAEDKKDKARQEQPSKNGKAEIDEGKKEGGSKLNASTLIGAFKVTSALLITGGINAFFFGVPIYIASGLSALVAGSQSFAALKIHKEDSEFGKKIVGFSRKLMGRQNDPTPAGKEWSMVPVWAGICGAFGLSEAMGNHLYKKFSGKVEKNSKERLKDLTEALGKNNGWLNCLKPVQKVQLKGMLFVQSAKGSAETLFENWATKGGIRKIPNKMYEYMMKSSGGKNMPLAYLWSFGMASFGGAAQTVLAALMQQKVDKAHGVKK